MKSCRAAVISLANFSGSEDRNNPGCRRSTGMNRANVHARRIGETGRGFGMQGKVRSLAAGYKMRNELHRYTTEYAKRLLHFSFLFLVFFLFLPAPRRRRDVAGWLAALINKIVATFANALAYSKREWGGRRITVIEHKSSLRRTHR